MKHVTISRHRLDRGRLLTALTGGLATGVALLASALVAQNNDNGGILPGMPGGAAWDASSGHDSVLAISGQVEGNELDSAIPVLRVTAGGYAAVGVASGVSEEEAEFLSDGTLVAKQLPSGALALQGGGTLNPEIGLHLALHAADHAVARAAVLIGSAADQPLDSVLSGATAPFAILAMGDLPSMDLALFHGLLQKHPHADAPFRVSVVFVSVDASGLVHLAAASGLTGGGALELAFQ